MCGTGGRRAMEDFVSSVAENLAVNMVEMQRILLCKKIYKMNCRYMDCNRIFSFGNKFLVM